MAAGSVVGLSPEASATGVSLTSPWRFSWTPYNGTGSLTEAQVKVATDAGMTAIVYDSGLLAIDEHVTGDGWHDRFPEDWPDGPAQPSTTYYWTVTLRNDSAETVTSAAVSFATEAAHLTATRWSEAQP